MSSTCSNTQYIDFTDILQLHCALRKASSDTITNLIQSLPTKLIKQLLLLYTEQLLQHETRANSLDGLNPRSSAHKSLLNAVASELNPTKYTTSKTRSIFSKLPTVLASEITSYLHQFDRIRLCRVNLLCAKYASGPSAISHLLVNRLFVNQQMRQSPSQLIVANLFLQSCTYIGIQKFINILTGSIRTEFLGAF